MSASSILPVSPLSLGQFLPHEHCAAATGSHLRQWGRNGPQSLHSGSRRTRSRHARAAAVDSGGLQSLHAVSSPAPQGSLVTVTYSPRDKAGLHGTGRGANSVWTQELWAGAAPRSVPRAGVPSASGCANTRRAHGSLRLKVRNRRINYVRNTNGQRESSRPRTPGTHLKIASAQE